MAAHRGALAVAVIVLAAAGCAHRGAVTAPGAAAAPGTRERGLASWYGNPYHGRRTASGEVYDMYDLTAAHRTLPFGTRVRVTRRDTGRSVDVRINDRGPFVHGRIIDLSLAAARRIGLDRDGVAPVVVEVLDNESPPAAESPAAAPPAAVPPTATPPEPSSAAAPPPAGCWWVQVGAFGELANARRAREQLAAAGETAVVMDGPNGLTRVRLGPFPDEATAAATRARVRAEWPAATVVGCGG